MKKTFIITVLIAGAAGLYQCSPSAEEKANKAKAEVQRDIRSEKEELAKDLRKQRDNINNDLDKLSRKLETAAEKSRADVEALRDNLVNQRLKIEEALDAIESSSDNVWDDIHQNAKNTANEVRVEMERLGERLKEVLNKDN